MITIDCNIFLFLFLAHFLDIFYEYQKYFSSYWTFQTIHQRNDPTFYTPVSIFKGIQLNIPSILGIFQQSQKRKFELEAKNIILEGIIKSESLIAFRINLKSPITFDYLNGKKDEFKKYDGQLKVILSDRKSLFQCIIEKSGRKNIKLYKDALVQITSTKKKDFEKKPQGFFKKFFYLSKSFFLDFFAFKHFTIGYEESEFIFKSNDFLRILGDVTYNKKENILKIEPKMIFSSLDSVLRNKRQDIDYLEKKMIFYILLFLVYFELRIYKAKHVIVFFESIMSKFVNKRHFLRFSEEKIDLQMLETNKSEVKCIICLDRVREIVFKPCNHMVICERCLYKLKELRCPMCRKNIFDIVLVFGEKKRE